MIEQHLLLAKTILTFVHNLLILLITKASSIMASIGLALLYHLLYRPETRDSLIRTDGGLRESLLLTQSLFLRVWKLS